MRSLFLAVTITAFAAATALAQVGGPMSVNAGPNVKSGVPMTVVPNGARAIDMTAVLHDETGRPGKDYFDHATLKPGEACTDCPPLTLGHAIAHALLSTLQGDDASFEQKWARAVLAERIKDDPKATLSAAETGAIEKRLGQVYGPIVVYQAIPILDPARKPPEIK